MRFEVVEDWKRARAGGATQAPVDVQMLVDVRILGTRTFGSGTIVRARVAVEGGEPSERYYRASWTSRTTGDVRVGPSSRFAWRTRPW